MRILSLLKFLWQLPQNLLALCILLFNKIIGSKIVKTSYSGVDVYMCKSCLGCGVSLGDFIIFEYDFYFDEETVKHEHGHQIQSLIFGPLYLIVIGITSGVFNNLQSRIFKKSKEWYYSRFPENWADKLGKVDTTKRKV